MIKNRLNRKYAVILALAVTAALFLPEVLLAQGAVVGYANGSETANVTPGTVTSFPTNSQLEKLTHVIARRIRCNADGNLTTATLPNYWKDDIKPANNIWNNETNKWLASLVERAHERGVKVSIGVTGSDYFNDAISNHLSTLVNNIVKFVNHYGFDGVDINWEYPEESDEWINCVNLLDSLKKRQELQCKRISMVLPANTPTSSRYCNQTPPIPQLIWKVVDAIHLMTYNEWKPPPIGWPTHTHAGRSNSLIKRWAEWGDSISIANSVNLNKNKLFVGSAFYGRNSSGLDVSYKDSNLGTLWSNPGDTQNDVKTKVDSCYNRGYGGVMIWELGHDIPDASDSTSLLYATWAANTAKGGYSRITITTQPAATTNVVQGSISGSLSVAATAASCVDGPNYQWYSNIVNSNTGGIVIPGATNANFPIPASLTAGKSPYYFYCIVNTRRSGVAKVVVAAPPPAPVISGSTPICSGAPKTFSATNWAQGYYWEKSSNLSLSSPTTNSTVTVSANGNGVGWVSVKNSSGTELARYDVWVGAPVSEPYINGIWRYNSPAVYNFRLETTFPNDGAPSVLWKFYPSSSSSVPVFQFTSSYPLGQYSFSSTSYGVTYWATAALVNTCGTGPTNYIYPRTPFTVTTGITEPEVIWSPSYPNPASDVINIEINQEAAARTIINPTFDIRLYDAQGNLLRQQKTKGGAEQFNVSALPDGIYYLHIYDGVSETPEIQQIMVEH